MDRNEAIDHMAEMLTSDGGSSYVHKRTCEALHALFDRNYESRGPRLEAAILECAERLDDARRMMVEHNVISKDEAKASDEFVAALRRLLE